MIQRNPTREVKIGNIFIGNGHPIAVQSMCATPTTDIEATLKQLRQKLGDNFSLEIAGNPGAQGAHVQQKVRMYDS